MLSIPFLAFTFGIIEIGLIYFVATTPEAATSEAAREIRTGQLQSAFNYSNVFYLRPRIADPIPATGC